MKLEEVKTYCRIDGDADDAQLRDVLIPAAIAYVKNAVEKKDLTEDNRVYKMALLVLINHWYNNRDIVNEGSLAEMPQLFRNLMMQLQTEDDHEIH